MKKKIRINGKSLKLSEINFNKHEFPTEVLELIEEYLSDSNSLTAQTSGSTGTPKKISIQKAHIRASALKTLNYLKIPKRGKALLCLSTAHIGGKMMVVRALEGGLQLVAVEPGSQPLASVDGTFDLAAMVPLQVQESVKELWRVKNLIIGGGPIAPRLEEKLMGLPNRIFHSYGMTETISHVALRRVNGARANDAYHALPGVSFAQDERGCLVINAPDIGVKKLVTNDVVELLDDRSFRWLGRADNVINSGGIKIHPEMVEKELGDLGFEYFLAGVPDEKLGHKLVMITSEVPSEVQMDAMSQRFKRLSAYHRPKKIICGPILKTSNGKTKRQASLEAGLREGGEIIPL